MKNIILSALFLLPFVIISCQKEAANNPSIAFKITGHDASDGTLKTAFINPEVNWQAGTDHIGVFCNINVTTPYATNVEYTAVSSGATSDFSSSSPIYWNGTTDEHDFGAYYPYVSGTFPFTAVPISLPAAQTQVGATTDHIGPLDFTVATPNAYDGVPGSNPTINFSFNHVFTILKFDITCANAHTLTQISVTKDAAPNLSLNTGSTIDISTYPVPALYTITEAAGGTPLNVTLTADLSITSTVASAYMVILPGDHSWHR